jgi:hypothetical protein
MKNNIRQHIRNLNILDSQLSYLGLDRELRWTQKLGEQLVKTGTISRELDNILKFLVKCSLEKKIAWIRDQELETADSEESEVSDASPDSTNLEINLERFHAGSSTVDIEDDPEGTHSSYNKYAPKEISTDDHSGKGFAGTSLMLFPNVRETEVELGEKGSWFKLFGIDKRIGTIITMYLGPNRRTNRYLTFQYIRLFKSIGGKLNNTYHWSEQLQRNYTVKSVDWEFSLKDIYRPKGIDHALKKKWRRNTRIFWAIGLNLIVNSSAFRVVMITSVLGKAKRWYHRDIMLAKLYYYNKSYLKIVKNRDTNMPIWRKWIPSGGKYRPLGIVPIAWRAYTKGLAIILSVFLTNSWAKNQHGYTKKRGTQTAWKQILTSVIKAKNVYEFDLVGYFNNINHRCIARMLERYQTPKYIILLLTELSCGPVFDIPVEEYIKYDTSVEADAFEADWAKHEYLQKYRDGWRSRGYPQGGSLSPLISIIPLIILEELGNDVKNLNYCDDGLLYCNSSSDLETVLQASLGSEESGVIVHPGKSRWVKKDGVWLTGLKFVGLRYDPFTDVLSACTRNGSTLPMQIDSVGLLTKEASAGENVFSDLKELHKDNPWALDYEPDLSVLPPPYRGGPLDSFWNANPGICESAGVMTPNQESFKWNHLHFYKIIIWIEATTSKYTPDVAERLVRNDCGLWFYYRNMAKIDPVRALNVLRDLDSFYTFSSDLSFVSCWEIVREVLSSASSSTLPILGPGQDLSGKITSPQNVGLQVDLLVWHKNMIRTNLEKIIERQGDFNLDKLALENLSLFKLDPLSALADALPDSLLSTAARHSWNVTLFLSRICWRNVVDTKFLGTLVSRLFIGSLSSDKIEQDFRLTYEKGSMVDAVFNALGSKREWAIILHNNNGLNVFNSTTVFSFILLNLVNIWDSKLSRRLKSNFPVNRIWWDYYANFVTKLTTRRSGPPPFSLINLRNGIEPELDFEKNEASSHIGINASKGTPPSLAHQKNARVKLQRALKNGIPIEAIAYSSCGESFYRGLEPFKEFPYDIHQEYSLELIDTVRKNTLPRPKNTDWLTWAPYAKGPRKSRTTVTVDYTKKRSPLNITRYFIPGSVSKVVTPLSTPVHKMKWTNLNLHLANSK